MNAIDPCYEIREREQASKKQQVIELLAPFRHANDLVASLLLSFDLAGFLVSTGFLIRYANRWTAPLLSLLIALFITRLFIIGHDCCHGSFFSRSKVNAVFGQLTMLPALVPYSPWAVGHNTLHHGYTGLRSRDFTWQPLSAGEYLALPPSERLFYRLCRTLPGVALYWIRELWLNKLIAPDRRRFPSLYRSAHQRDRRLVLAFLIGWAAAVSIGRAAGVPAAAALFWAILAPTVLFSWIMGITIYLHHTGPDAVWFADRKQWEFFESQFRLTPNLCPPSILSVGLHHIYCHLPHHPDINVPLYRLEAAMQALKCRFQSDIVEKPIALRDIQAIFKTCQLYDFEKNMWVPFRILARKEEQ